MSAPIPGIGRQAAVRLARAELSKPAYHPHTSLTVRIARAVAGWLGRLLASAGKLPGGWWSVAALAALVVIAVTLILGWTGPVMRTRRRARAPMASGRGGTARDHREAAGRHAAAGDYGAAICETVRAMAAELEERGVLLARPGRTADEFAAEAALAVAGHGAALRGAAVLFDEVRYGRRPGTQDGYQRVRDTDESVRASAGRAGAARVGAGQAGAGQAGAARVGAAGVGAIPSGEARAMPPDAER